jgi:LysR family hydrogen peroxide-inducible transcriptional activator
MNIQQIEYVVAVYQIRHFGLAAEKCFITQSTLSTMIGRFEDEIGMKLFDRASKPIAVTQEGEEIIPQLQIILKELENLNEQVKSLRGEVGGELHIGIIPTVAPYLLPTFLHSFTKKYPQIHFVVQELTTDSIVAKLRRRELDIGIAALPLQEPTLKEFPLYNEEFVLFDCSTEDKVQTRTIKEIDFANFWMLEEGHCMSVQVYHLCELKNKHLKTTMNVEFKAGSIDSLIRFVKQSKGTTILPHLATLDFTVEDMQRVHPFDDVVPVRSIGLLTHQHFVKKKMLRLMQEEIIERMTPLLKPIATNQVMSPR